MQNQKIVVKSKLIVFIFTAGIFLAGCITDNTSTTAASSPQVAAPTDSGILYGLGTAYELQKDVATVIRLSHPNSASVGFSPQVPAPISVVGWAPSPSPAGNNSTHTVKVQSALFKSSAQGNVSLNPLAKISASGGKAVLSNDSNWFTKGDSAKDSTLWIHTYHFVDSAGSGEGIDSIKYVAPYSSANPAVLSHKSTRTYSDGKMVVATVMDDDGKPVLNEAAVGGFVKLKKQWLTKNGDTTWKTIVFTTHGQTTFYDSLGAGKISSWTDSIFIKGQVIGWEKIRDGDNDGFVLSHTGNGKTKVIRESYVELPSGDFRNDYETWGAGADGDYLASADNERYSLTSSVIGSDGKDKISTSYMDADGDGYFWTPSAGAKNQIIILNTYPANDSVTMHTDSIVETMPTSGKLSEAKIDFFQSNLKYKDGSESYVKTKASKSSFTMGDTITLWNHRSYLNYTAKIMNDSLKMIDSTLQVVWIVTNDLTNPDDDKIVKWFSQTFYKSGQPILSMDEVFTPSKALSKGEAVASGTSIMETNFNSTGSASVTRKVLYRTYDPSKTQKDWKEVQYFENGDSSVFVGTAVVSGARNYLKSLGDRIKNSGIADNKTGSFKDTLKYLDTTSKSISEEYCEGLINPTTGVGEFDRTISRQGKNIKSQYKISISTGSALQIQKTGDIDTALISLSGDTASLSTTNSGIKNSFTGFSSTVGIYQINLVATTTKEGAKVNSGTFKFSQDGNGTGSLIHYDSGKATTESKVGFHNDGALFLEGVKINK